MENRARTFSIATIVVVIIIIIIGAFANHVHKNATIVDDPPSKVITNKDGKKVKVLDKEAHFKVIPKDARQIVGNWSSKDKNIGEINFSRMTDKTVVLHTAENVDKILHLKKVENNRYFFINDVEETWAVTVLNHNKISIQFTARPGLMGMTADIPYGRTSK